MTMINISNVINISVILPPVGLASYAVNNLVCFTKDSPLAPLSGDYAAYSSAADVATDFGTTSATYKAAVAVFSQTPNIKSGGGLFVVVPMENAETLDDAIVRAKTLVYFGGCSYAYSLAGGEALAAAAVAESERKLLFITSDDDADLLSPNGLFYKIQSQTLPHARCLFHTDADSLDAFRWGYAGRAMATNFGAARTTSTMHLKSIAGVSADEGLTQTLLNEAKAVGADIYANVAGLSVCMSYGANSFFDDVFNLDWFIGALEVAGFNYLRQTGTKVPQTEPGMDGLKGAYRQVCTQAITNGFVAPGTWTSADTFGDPEDFTRNIGELGYYIYSVPVSQQAVADRNDRKAPAVSIAVKYAGAIHSSDVLVFVNK